ncbi:helix-turn-helix domain-containing protein [Chryseobacterium paridis]|uniref:Helix-turn-helix transcriptional regulator n=1 Tax=Chryseobacterium paridis TaxID=2800328 RepID=A0ABS1FUP7_9FLAO|nr:helix-turn-helix transcriptional regulator [Chryseobacterium paridis]MBK1896142.1 helix-turn-helix transcriptional regulator [Chryseobacterium paridis]
MKILFSLVLLFSNLIFAQKGINRLQEFNYEQLKKKFFDNYDQDKTTESIVIAKYYLQKAKQENNKDHIAEGYILMHINVSFQDALKYLDSLSIITKNSKGNVFPAKLYLLKGNVYYKYDNLKSALDNYILGLKYAKLQNNKDQIAYADMNIAYLNTYIGKNKDAIKIFRHYLYNTNYLSEFDYQQLHISLTNSYIELSEIDSANILIKEGLKEAIVNKNKYSQSQYLYLSGNYNIKIKNYKRAVEDLKIAESYFSSIHDINVNSVLYSLGKAYDGLNQKDKTIQNFTKLDSLVVKTNNTFPELKEVYTYLIDYFKKKNNTEKQLYYIDRFLKVNQKLDEQFKYLSVELPKKYDAPNLLQEKQNIIDGLKRKKIFSYTGLIALTLLLIILSFLFYKSKKAEKKHKKIAQNLIYSIENRPREQKNNEKESILEEIVEIELEEKIVKNISDNVKLIIIKELENFENKKLFLKKGITLSSLAKSINTNTTYLSDIINNTKAKNFTTYINDLRIDYALERLVEDKKFRSYKLPIIAEELGYNNVQAFSVVFKKKTGTTPSIYIKEIEISLQ